MFEKKIREQIANELITVEGNCPEDSSCKYAFGSKCTAPEDFLKKKFAAAQKEGPPPREKGEKVPYGWIYTILGEDKGWPCARMGFISFVQPDI